MLTLHLHLKKISKPKHTRLLFYLKKLKDPNVLETLQTMIGSKFAALTIMTNENTDMDSMITTFNTAVPETTKRSLANIIRRQKLGSLQKFLICATKGEN